MKGLKVLLAAHPALNRNGEGSNPSESIRRPPVAAVDSRRGGILTDEIGALWLNGRAPVL